MPHALAASARVSRRPPPPRPLLLAPCFLFLPVFTTAATWDGGAGTSNWTDAANWSGDTPPPAIDGAAFNGASSHTISLGDRSLTLLSFSGNSAYTLSGHSLTLSAVTGTISTASPSTGSLTHSLATAVSLSGATSEIATASGTTLSFTGGLAASGLLTKSGAGTLILSGATNTFSSGAAVTAGTLQLGAGGTTGSATGDIAVSSGATVAFNRSDAFEYTQVVSGAGSVTQTGASTLRIKAAQTFTGPLTISTGNVAIGFGTGSVATPSIVNHATLIWNDSDTQTYSGVISGAGTLYKVGSGTRTLSGDNTFTGPARLEGGILRFTGALGGGTHTGEIITSSGTTLDFASSSAQTLTGVLSDTGALIYSGGGLLTLTGDNTYADTTTVANGTLLIGNGGTSGGIAGDLSLTGAPSARFPFPTATPGTFPVSPPKASSPSPPSPNPRPSARSPPSPHSGPPPAADAGVHENPPRKNEDDLRAPFAESFREQG